jgi:protocatechuate 3,4-dioxygenase beta subunit
MIGMRIPAPPLTLSLAIVAVPSALLLLSGCTSAESADAPAVSAVASAPSASAAGSPAPSASAVASPAPSAVASASPSAADATACDPSATIVELTEGPYYTPGAPDRTVLREDDTVGTPLVVTGTVFDAQCQPVPGAVLDVWQADGAGVYDNEGYDLRGVQTTDANGRYSITTVIPGIYPGRTEHIHFTVTAPDGAAYTSQFFFPGSEQNAEDGIYVEEMELSIDSQDDSGMTASFDLVLP